MQNTTLSAENSWIESLFSRTRVIPNHFNYKCMDICITHDGLEQQSCAVQNCTHLLILCDMYTAHNIHYDTPLAQTELCT